MAEIAIHGPSDLLPTTILEQNVVLELLALRVGRGCRFFEVSSDAHQLPHRKLLWLVITQQTMQSVPLACTCLLQRVHMHSSASTPHCGV